MSGGPRLGARQRSRRLQIPRRWRSRHIPDLRVCIWGDNPIDTRPKLIERGLWIMDQNMSLRYKTYYALIILYNFLSLHRNVKKIDIQTIDLSKTSGLAGSDTHLQQSRRTSSVSSWGLWGFWAQMWPPGTLFHQLVTHAAAAGTPWHKHLSTNACKTY